MERKPIGLKMNQNSATLKPYLPTDPTEYSIGVLIPTRGRAKGLEESVKSLLELADDPKRIRILLGPDQDDTETIEHGKNVVLPYIESKGASVYMIAFERLGYLGLAEYYNRLVPYAHSDWFILWNDDARMKTQGWDTEIRKYDGQFKVLAFDTHNHHPYSIFPIVPMDWVRLLGSVSNHQMIDAVISHIAYYLDIMVRTDIKVDHLRPDVVGEGEYDATYKERVLLEGDPSNPADLHHVRNVAARYLWADRLAWWLKGQGRDMSFWQGVKNGTQDPWVKLRENDPNGLTRVISTAASKKTK